MESNDNLYQSILESWSGKATPEQRELVAKWRQASPEHEACYRELFHLYYQVNGAGKYDKIDAETAKSRVMRQLSGKRKSARSRRMLFTWITSAAACLLVALTLLYTWSGKEKENMQLEVAQVVGGQADVTLVLGNGQEVSLARDSSFELKVGNVNVQQHSGDGLRYVGDKDSLSENVPVEYNTIRVPRGGEYVLTLSDGTKVWLNSATDLRFPVRFTGKTREVEIIGEGYFEVAKDARHPFIVRSGEMRLQVLGTSFNVKAYADETIKSVTLVTGKVQVKAAQEEEVLLPGWQSTWDERERQLDKCQVNVEPIISWRMGMFDFAEMPLEELVVQLSRWYDVDFFFVNQNIKKIRFTGAIKRSNSLKFMLDFLEMTSGVRYEIKGKTVCLYSVK